MQRELRAEVLETRQLLAANIFHNADLPADVNQDGIVTPHDVLTIVNGMNRQAAGTADAAGDSQSADTPRMTDVNNDGQESPLDALIVINRLNRRPSGDDAAGDGPAAQDGAASPVGRPSRPPTAEVRSLDGTGNNLDNPTLGATGTQLLRVAENDYANGISTPAGEDRPSARVISNTLSATLPGGVTSERNLSSYVFAWGQFLDHDIDLSLEPADPAEAVSFDIEVPSGDPYFDPFDTGQATIHLTRSAVADGTGTSMENPAEQVNSITAWVDGSQVYGSDQVTSDALREFSGGRLLISDDGLLPSDENGILAGDVRAAENVVLTSMHALFVREHNRLADEISAANPALEDEDIFQAARAIVIAELQSITYNEYLPALLGEDALSRYRGYDPSVNPSIANEFSTAAFRFGHSTLNDEFRLVGNDGEEMDDPISLANAFFTPQMLEDTGIEPFLKYAASTQSQEVDLQVVDSLRNFLFGAPGSGGLDLVSLNIQRGRDHGLADYNSTRVAYGLDPIESFAEITRDGNVQANLAALYGDVNNIDLWVGLMAEDHTDNGSLGQTATAIIADQFERLRDGDRLFYANTMDGRLLREVENTTLGDIISRNTSVDTMQANVFYFAPAISGRVVAEAAPPPRPAGDQPAATSPERDGPDNVQRDRQTNDSPAAGQRPPGQPPRDPRPGNPAEGILVELLDREGNLLASTRTDSDGLYAFDAVTQSGAYQVRLAASDDWSVAGPDHWDLSISNGDEAMDRINFRIIVS